MIHSFLLIGQSNAAGRGFLEDAAPLDHCNGRLKVQRNGLWLKMFRPVNPDRSFSGTCLAESFAKEYAMEHPLCEVGIIPCADGGTTISQWQPGEILFDNALNCARLAMRTSTLKGILWHQGESDSLTQSLASQYAQLESTLVNKVRTSFIGRDNDAHIGFVNGAIAAYNEAYNIWTYADIVNSAKANAATLWYVPADTSGNVINTTTAGLYANPSGTITNSIWIDTSTCISKLQNNNENGENDGYHYCGVSMFEMGIWYAQGMLQVSGF